MKIQIISLFPEALEPYLNVSMMFKASNTGAVIFSLINLRDFGIGIRKTVDDIPYGGGDGMVLKPEPVVSAIEHAKKEDPEALVILPTPRGELYKQSHAKKLAKEGRGLILVCPRYEGYDERITKWVDHQFCLGSYVLTGGELPALTIIDSVVRLIPGVLGGETSAEKESFQKDDMTIEAPHYTRPAEFQGMKVPDVLMNGNHVEIDKWRNKN